MKLLQLFWRLLRYRVAVMLLLFMLLGVAIHGELGHKPWLLVIAAFSLAFSYISATSINDIADKKIDVINHPNSAGRPLVLGIASTKDMWLSFGLASLFALILCALINVTAVLIMVCSIFINLVYSLPPFRLSYRTFLAPFILGIAYIGVPYSLGLATVGIKFHSSDIWWLLGFYIMFIGRIILKDFRDRKGDKKYNKPTLLLRYGKTTTCLISGLLVISGSLILLLQVKNTIWLIILIVIFMGSILAMLWRLYRSMTKGDEQLAIGVGAKMGNGLLISLLCVFILKESNVSQFTQITATSLIVLPFFISYISFIRNPTSSTIVYKG